MRGGSDVRGLRLPRHRGRGASGARATVIAAAFAVAAAAGLTAGPASAQDHPGKPVYDKWCAGCHGVEGRGDGPAAAYMLPRPRDFTTGQYQIRSTGSGELPTDADLMRIIDDGMPGTAMPGWRNALTQAQRESVADYLKTFSRFFQNAQPPEPMEFGSAPRVSDERLEEGRAVFERMECFKCHGNSGRGDGQSAPTQTDDLGHPIRPADLTEPWYFSGGGTAEDVFRRFRTGLNGTPMPSYSDAMDAGVVSEDELWSLALYVRSMAPATPAIREVVRAARVETGELPGLPGDTGWAAAERFYIPLVGQIIVKPRWFAPAVDGVWVEALHDGQELALRLSWTDPSRSPAPEWAEWRSLVTSSMEPRESDAAAAPQAAPAQPAAQPPANAQQGGAQAANAQGAAAQGAPGPAESAQAAVPAALPDVIAVQFPRRMPTGMDRPYFLMGSAREPVYLWTWSSQPDRVVERTARGLGQSAPVAADGGLTGAAAWEAGQWRVVMRRPLVPADTTDAITLPTGQPVPIALFAWDGDNGESGTRAAISTWYFVHLEEPTPATVYATPIVAMLLTAGLGVFAVGRAQRREHATAVPDKD